MKKYSILIAIFLFVLSVSAQDDVYTNKLAPANYDANLKKGDKAVGVVISSLEAFTIVSKSGGIYLATEESSGREYSLRANSVYPYFDIQQFGEIIEGKEDLITPYLECYAKKHNQDAERLKGNGFRPRNFLSYQMQSMKMPRGSKVTAFVHPISDSITPKKRKLLYKNSRRNSPNSKLN